MQHYALFAAALALFSLSLTHVKRRFGIWVWLMVMVVVLLLSRALLANRRLETVPHGGLWRRP